MERYSENGLELLYEIAGDGSLRAMRWGLAGESFCVPAGERDCCIPFSVRFTGETTSYMGGNRHFGVSGVGPWKFAELRREKMPDGTHLIFGFERDQLRISVHYRLYRGIPVLRAWTEIENNGPAPVGVEYLSSFCQMGIAAAEEANNVRVWIPHNAWRREADWKEYTLSELGMEKIGTHSTKRISLSNTGSWSTKEYLPMGAWLRGSSDALLWQIENNGSWQWEISDEGGPLYLLLGGPNESENQWYRSLKAGERFESVKAAVAFGRDFDDALAAITRYRRSIREPFAADRNLPVIFNDYMNCLWAKPTAEKELPLIRRAAELGAEYYCMDAGWYADENNWWDTIGAWVPSEKRFPNGISEVFHAIRKAGMVPGLWLEIENMGIRCPLAGRFREESFVRRHGKRVIDKGRYQLDFRSEEVRAFANGVVDRLVRDYGIGYFKIDYNIDIGAGTETESDSFGDGLLQMNRAYLSWIGELHRRYPNVVLENCSSGGMRMDYAMLSKHALQSVSDQENCVRMAPIAAAAATAVLPEQAAVWVYPKSTDSMEEIRLNLVNALPLRIHLSGEVLNLNGEQLELVQKGIALYREMRSFIPKSIPFYPLGIPQYGGNWLCAGYRGERTYLAVWRLGAGNSVFIPMKNKIKDVRNLLPDPETEIVCSAGGIRVKSESVPFATVLEVREAF